MAAAAGIEATGVLVGASSTVLAAVTAMSGCIGGATSTAATLALGGGDTSWKSTLANAITGCITGATIASLSLAERAKAAPAPSSNPCLIWLDGTGHPWLGMRGRDDSRSHLPPPPTHR